MGARPRSARGLAWPDLVWSHFSRPRFGEFDARVAAAANAGFAGIGLYVHEYRRLRDEEHRTPADIAAVLDHHGIVLADVEVARGWWATAGPEHDECRLIEAIAYEMADALEVRYLQAIGPYECSFQQAVDRFAELCDRAAEHGLLVGIEWLPYTNIATAADARAIVEAAGRPNGGYCADIWHHTRSGDDLAALRSLAPDRVFAIQMNDGPRLPLNADDYKADCLANRLPPGDGEFDSIGFLTTLAKMGVTAPISIEVCNTALWAGPVDAAARVAADGMRHLLTQVDTAK